MNIISKKLYGVYLNYQQKQVSNLFKYEELTDRVLEKQAKINEIDSIMEINCFYLT